MSHERERLSAYLDDELTPVERAAVEAHLQGCAECAERLAALRAADEALAAESAEAPRGYFEAFPGRVRARLEAKAARKGLPAWTWAAAAALVLAVVTPLTLRDRPSDLAPPSLEREARGAPVVAPASRPSEQQAPAALPSAAPPSQPPAAPPPATLGDHAEQKQSDTRLRTNAASELQQKPEADFARAPDDRGVASDTRAAGALAAAAPEPVPAATASREGAAAREEESAPGRAAAPKEDADAFAPAVRQQESVAASSPGAAGARTQSMRRAPDAAEPTGSVAEWRRLLAVRAATPEEWRRLREDWRLYVARDPEGERADTARLRMIEAGRAAWRASADPADEAVFREDAAAYLEREAAPRKDRVRRLLTEPR